MSAVFTHTGVDLLLLLLRETTMLAFTHMELCALHLTIMQQQRHSSKNQ
jgi:hypothetical protein